MRTGLLGRKLGMTRVLKENGEHIPVTLVDVSNNVVVNVKTAQKNGYYAVQLGYGEQKSSRISKSQRAYFAKQKVSPKRKLREFRVSEDAILNTGDLICCSHFVVGQRVDVAATSIGKGFAGVMKRHNFSGLRASHGVSIAHRSQGSTGQCQDPGKVFKGKKMAGQMGSKRVTMQNLEVVLVDVDQQLVAVRGHVPGAKNAFVEIRDAVKSKGDHEAPFPAKIAQSLSQTKSGNTASDNSSKDSDISVVIKDKSETVS